MKENSYNTLEDLLAAPSFQQWVRNEPGPHVTFWEDWMKQNPEKKALIEKARLILKGVSFEFQDRSVSPRIVQAEWEKLNKRTAEQGPSPLTTAHVPRKRPRRIGLWGWRAAASVALLAVLGFLLQQYVFNPFVVHQTPFGKQLSIILPDSTAIELNANSVLTYRKQNPRKVWLDGEAFFEVKKKPATGANFQVITNDLTVEVLGTAFNVIEREYRTEVILEEGSIKLQPKQDKEQEVYMEPGEMAIFSAKTSKHVKKQQVKPESLISWKTGMLVFEDVPVSQIMERIEEIYGWRAVYQDEEIQNKNISTPLPSNDLESALELLSKAIGITIDKVAEDRVLLLY